MPWQCIAGEDGDSDEADRHSELIAITVSEGGFRSVVGAKATLEVDFQKVIGNLKLVVVELWKVESRSDFQGRSWPVFSTDFGRVDVHFSPFSPR